jgi:hypothetical protein
VGSANATEVAMTATADVANQMARNRFLFTYSPLSLPQKAEFRTFRHRVQGKRSPRSFDRGVGAARDGLHLDPGERQLSP